MKKNFKLVILCVLIIFNIIGCGENPEVKIEQYNPTEKEKELLSMHYKDMDYIQRLDFDTLRKEVRKKDERKTIEIRKDLGRIITEKEEFENTPPVKPDYTLIFEKEFKDPYIFLDEVTTSNIDYDGIMSSHPNMLLDYKISDNSHEAYIACYKDSEPIKDKNGIEVKENDKLKISRAEVTKWDIAGLPEIFIEQKDIEIIN